LAGEDGVIDDALDPRGKMDSHREPPCLIPTIAERVERVKRLY
jgi:hypothetical protein